MNKAAVAIWCDVAPAVREEFDDWHAHEHMPERLSIPGFRRGTRWVATEGDGYMMVYETESEATVSSGPYLERLNNPSVWSRKLMPHHRNMVRSLCRVRASFGAALGRSVLSLRFSPGPDAGRVEAWLCADLLPDLPSRRGIVAAHFFHNIQVPQAAPTTEQKIRGGDAAADWIVLVHGYSTQALRGLAEQEFKQLAAVAGIYDLAYVLTDADCR